MRGCLGYIGNVPVCCQFLCSQTSVLFSFMWFQVIKADLLWLAGFLFSRFPARTDQYFAMLFHSICGEQKPMWPITTTPRSARHFSWTLTAFDSYCIYILFLHTPWIQKTSDLVTDVWKGVFHCVDQGNFGLRSQGPLHGLETWEAGGLRFWGFHLQALPSPTHLVTFPRFCCGLGVGFGIVYGRLLEWFGTYRKVPDESLRQVSDVCA